MQVDEGMLTGESRPVAKGPGDPVIGGTLSLSGAMVIRADRVGADTALSKIVALVEHAQMSKAPIQAYADRISAVFVPTIIALAVATFSTWRVQGRSRPLRFVGAC